MYGKTGYTIKNDYDKARYRRLKVEREKTKPPHPITQLTETEKAYIAGLIDGEGAIYCAHVRETWYPTISIHMTSDGVLRWLAQKTGAQKIHSCKPRGTVKYKSIPKTQYLFRMSGQSAKLLCEALLPYLRIKSNHANVVCSFPIENRHGPGHYLDPAINKIKQRLAEQLEAFNENRYKRRHAQ